MTDPKPDPGNSGPDQWAGEDVDDEEAIAAALRGEYDHDDEGGR
jgi:hypothetical protein